MIDFRRIGLSELEPNTGQIPGLPANPRAWTDREVRRLAKSMKATPELAEARGCIVVPHEGRYVVLGGNLRLEGAKSLKWRGIMCAVLPEDTKPAKLQEIVLKDNSSFGSWDLSLLRRDWGHFDLPEWGIEVTWDTAGPDPTRTETEVREDDFDDRSQDIEARCKRGDIWQLGDHRLMCGDSTAVGDLQMLMGGAKADMVFTDPPYGVSYTEKNEFLNSLGTGHRLTKAIENDSNPPQDMYEFWVKAFKNIHAATKDKMAYYITAPQGGDLLLLLLQAVRDSGFMLKHQLIWNKNNHVLGRCDYNYKHEPIIYGWKIGGTHKFVGGGPFKTSVWDVNKPLKNDLHPTMKPVELIAAAVLDNSNTGDAVLDCFGGSGSTLMACEQTGRHCYMMEYDEHYCDVIIARWEKYTGRKATKIN